MSDNNSQEQRILHLIDELTQEMDALEREGINLRKEIVDIRDKMHIVQTLKKISTNDSNF